MSHEDGHPPLARGGAPEPPPLSPRAWMKEPGEKPGFWDRRSRVTLFLRGFYACLAILVALEFVIHPHVYHAWENVPAFHALYGFAACWILVVIAKQMRRVLMRSEDYYDAD